MMIRISSPDHHPLSSAFSQETITTSICTSWKLYNNPYYHSQPKQQQELEQEPQLKHHHLQHLHLPLSARKVAASFWDLTFIRAVMESELETAQARIIELKAELDYERKSRRRAESMNKRLIKDLEEERRGSEALEKVCEQLAREISSDKSEIDRMKREMEEERKMLRVAEVLREERVQMKLTDAKLFLEEKLSELEGAKCAEPECVNTETVKQTKQEENKSRMLARVSSSPAYLSGKFARLVLGEKTGDEKSFFRITNSGVGTKAEEEGRVVLRKRSTSCKENGDGHYLSMAIQQKRSSPEPENPHIKRGIKGFVEFPRVIRAIRSKSGHWGSKIECQRAQLKIMPKQRSASRSNSLVAS